MKRNRLMLMSIETDFEEISVNDHSVICEEKIKKDAWYDKNRVKKKSKDN